MLIYSRNRRSRVICSFNLCTLGGMREEMRIGMRPLSKEKGVVLVLQPGFNLPGIMKRNPDVSFTFECVGKRKRNVLFVTIKGGEVDCTLKGVVMPGSGQMVTFPGAMDGKNTISQILEIRDMGGKIIVRNLHTCLNCYSTTHQTSQERREHKNPSTRPSYAATVVDYVCEECGFKWTFEK